MFLLGIDGGGSGCRAVLADGSGRQLGLGAAGPANIATDPEGACANVVAAARQAIAGAGGDEGLFGSVTAVLGLAGAGQTAAVRQAQKLLPFRRVRILPDAICAAVGALRGADGIVAAIGTGSVFVLCRGGTMRRFGGHGFRLGDQGGAAGLGRALLIRTLRATDGFAEMTPLMQSALDELGGIEGVIAFGRNAAPADFARFAQRIATGEDPAGAAIFAEATAEVGAVLAHLQAQAGPLPVVFLGGLGDAYARHLGGSFETRPAAGTGLDGALWLAAQDAA